MINDFSIPSYTPQVPALTLITATRSHTHTLLYTSLTHISHTHLSHTSSHTPERCSTKKETPL